MMPFLNYPYKIFGYLVLILTMMTVWKVSMPVDFLLHDTYIVFSWLHLEFIFILYVGLMGWMYWLVRRMRLIKILTTIHLVVTLVLIIGLYGILFCTIGGQLDFFNDLIGRLSAVLIFGLIIAPFIWIVNVSLSLLKNKA